MKSLIRNLAGCLASQSDIKEIFATEPLRERGIFCGLMRRPNKHHPVLKAAARRFNRAVAIRRASVETTFATLKRRMGLSHIRYIGLAKASGQVLLAAMAFNMRRWVTLST